MTDDMWFESWQGQGGFLTSKTSKPDLEPSKPLIQPFLPGIKPGLRMSGDIPSPPSTSLWRTKGQITSGFLQGG
jgi:hypothetical protein